LEAGIGNVSISAEHERVLSVPSFKTIEQKSSMDEQKEMLPPAATRPSELPFPAKQQMLNPNASERFAKPPDRDIHQSDGSLQQFVQFVQFVIKSCVTMDSVLRYQTAMKLLKDCFGHPFKIATAHVNQVTCGPAVKPNDQRGLQTFADKLKDCQNMLELIGYLDEVNSSENLRSIIDRLPFHLRAKWLDVADSIQESGQRPRIPNISTFVSDKACAANNPICGGALISDKEKSKKDRSGKKISSLNTMASSHATHGNFSGPGSCVLNQRESHNRQLTLRQRRSGSRKCLLRELPQLWNCEQFKKSFEDQMKRICDVRLCDNCFQVGHFATGCMQKSGSYIEGCNGKHMTVIHPLE